MFSALLKDTSKRKRALKIRRQKADAQPKHKLERLGSRNRPIDRSPSSRTDERVLNAGEHKRSKVEKSQFRSRSSTFDQDSEDSEDSERTVPVTSKRLRVNPSSPKSNRTVRALDAFRKNLPELYHIVHAITIPSLDRSTKYEPCFPGPLNDSDVEVQYPSCSPRERYSLIKPSHDDSAFHAVSDILAVMSNVSEHYIPDSVRPKFDDEMNGYLQRLNRAVKKQSLAESKLVLEDYNRCLIELLETETLGHALDDLTTVPSRLVEYILNQTYARTVSPNLKSLRLYEAGTDNVYGELLPRFVSDILRQDVRMTPDQVFVDLGSGVGNIVMQAALEIGCESWGCEMMEHFSDIADRQLAEFTSRCRMWGLCSGRIRLERGDFLVNDAIKAALRRADVVLVNNQVFTPALNEALIALFLDLKDGCRVVSLKSFVPPGYKISERNSESPINLFSVHSRIYFSSCVSWTSQGGSYYISTKDSSRIQTFRTGGKGQA